MIEAVVVTERTSPLEDVCRVLRGRPDSAHRTRVGVPGRYASAVVAGASTVVPSGEWSDSVRRAASRLIAAGALLIAVLVLAPSGRAGGATNPSLDVTFSVSGAISVTLPDGTPVGSPNGAPTVIPAGYYTLLMSGPGGCTELPYFMLKGPGENVLDDMDLGEMKASENAYFLPNSTYTWSDDAYPDVVYTFVTSADVEGTSPPPASTDSGSPVTGTQSTVSSQDVVGSAIAPFRGTLTGAVSPAGTLTLAYRGKSVTSLSPGRYAITVADNSTRSGFMLEKNGHDAMRLTGAAFVGKRTATVDLTSGRWVFGSRLPRNAAHAVVVTRARG